MKKCFWLAVLMVTMSVALFAQDTGGPDTYGYTYANSNAASGPTFDWIAPSTANEDTTFTDDSVRGPFPIGFEFPYYGTFYNEYWLCSNGWLSFAASPSSDRTPEAIPGTATPNNMIAWMWKDLDPVGHDTTPSHAYYENLASDNSHLLTFVDYHEWPGESDEAVNAQIRLYPNGDILMQYHTFTDSFPLSDAACGIENVDGTDGLQYAYQDSLQFGDNLAVMFTYPVGEDNDLSCENVDGPVIVNVGVEQTYTVSVSNVGALTQDNYMVQLYYGNSTLASEVSGTSIDPFETLTFDLTWTPDTEGEIAVWGEVALTGDTAPDNDVSDQLAVTVYSADVTVASVGDGTDFDYKVPINFFYQNGLSECIYFPDEINASGEIVGMSWSYHFESTIPDKPIKVWMAHTDLDSLTSFVPSGDMTLVYEGDVAGRPGEGEMSFTLDNSFGYNGTDNLLVLTYRVMDTTYFAMEDEFYYTNTPNRPARSIEDEDDNDLLDPANPPTSFDDYDYVPNTTFFLQPVSTTGINGFVRDTSDNAIEGATLTVGTETVTSNTDGSYFFALDAGTYDITASKDGYLDQTFEDIVVNDGAATTQNFSLVPVTDVTVTATCNDSGSPEGATMTLANDDYDFEETFGAAGEINLTDVPLGAYTLTVSLTGYDTHTSDVTVSDNDTFNVSLLETLTVPGNLACDTEGLFSWDAPSALSMRRATTAKNLRRETEPVTRTLNGYEVYLDGSLVTTITDTEYLFTGLTAQQQYTAGVKAVYTNGNSDLVTVDFTYDPQGVNGDVPAVNAWLGNYPNPFNPTTTLRFSLAEAQNVRIDIYNMRGQKVRTLLNETRPAGDHTVTWNGDDDNGHTQASGVYMGRLQASSFTSTFKMIMMK